MPSRVACLLAPSLLLLALPTTAADILALDKEGGRLHVVDLDTFALRHSVPIGEGAHEVIASHDGRSAWVALYGDQQRVGHHLVEVDLAGGTVTRKIDTTPLLRPHGMARAGQNIYFTAEMNRAVARLNPGEGRVDRVLGIGRDATHMIEVSADGQQLFTTDLLSNSVSRLDFRVKAPLPKLTHYAVGDKPEGLALHPDGKHAWVGLNGEGKVQVLDIDSGKIVATMPAGSYPARIEFSRDGKRVFVIDPKESALLVFDAASRKRLHAHRIPGTPLGILPAKDVSRVILTLVTAGELVEVDAGSGEVVRRLDVGKVADGIALADAG